PDLQREPQAPEEPQQRRALRAMAEGSSGRKRSTAQGQAGSLEPEKRHAGEDEATGPEATGSGQRQPERQSQGAAGGSRPRTSRNTHRRIDPARQAARSGRAR